MPHSVVSDVDLHCLPLSHKTDARRILVKKMSTLIILDETD